MTLIASGTGYIEFFLTCKQKGILKCEQTIVSIETLLLNSFKSDVVRL